MIKKYIDRKYKPKLRYLTFRVHRKLRYAVLVLFGLATLVLAVTLSGLPTTPEILDVAGPADWAAPILFAAALALTAFTLGKACVFRTTPFCSGGSSSPIPEDDRDRGTGTRRTLGLRMV